MAVDLETKLIRAKLKLQFECPFFGFLILKAKLKKEENGELRGNPIGVSKDMVITYNPEMLDRWDEETIKVMLIHELLHVSLEHLKRKGNRDLRLWNAACDFVANSIIRDMGLWRHLEVFYESHGVDFFDRFNSVIGDIEEKDLFAEKIYDLLRDVQKGSSQGSGSGGHSGDDDDDSQTDNQDGDNQVDEGSAGDSQEPQKVPDMDVHNFEGENYMDDFEITQAVIDAYTANEMSKGRLPSALEDMIERMRKPKVDWRRFLNGVFTSLDYSDFSYARYSKKSYLVESKGIKLPGLERSEQSRFLVCVDVSGSIPKEDIEKFLGEVKGLSRLVEADGDVIFHDTRITKEIPIKDLKIPLGIRLGGGTSHGWLEDIDMRRYDRVILFTDGYTDFPAKEKVIPSKMVWFVTTDDGMKNIKDNCLGIVFKYENQG